MMENNQATTDFENKWLGLSPRAALENHLRTLEGIKVILRHDTLDNWIKHATVLLDHEIAVIDMPDGSFKTVIGDGSSKAIDCPELNHPITNLELNKNHLFLPKEDNNG